MQNELFLNAYKQQNEFMTRERRPSYDNELNQLHQRNQQLTYHDMYYAQRLLEGFASIDHQPRLIEGFTSIDRQPRGFNYDSPSHTPRSITNASSSFATTRDTSPVFDCSASSPPISIAPCRQLPCRYIY